MQPLSLVLAQAIRKMNIAKPFAMHSLIGHWRQLVGDDIADHSQPQKVEFGVLVVMVDSSVWTHHLTLLKTDILQKIHILMSIHCSQIPYMDIFPAFV